MKLVYIEWIDSASLTGGNWHHHDEVDQLEPMRMKTVGYVQKETKKYITVAGHVSEHCVCGDMCIPKFAIKKIRRLHLRRK